MGAGRDEPLRRIDEFREPTTASTRVPKRQSCRIRRRTIVRRRLDAPPERLFPELASGSASAFVGLLFVTPRRHGRETSDEEEEGAGLASP